MKKIKSKITSLAVAVALTFGCVSLPCSASSVSMGVTEAVSMASTTTESVKTVKKLTTKNTTVTYSKNLTVNGTKAVKPSKIVVKYNNKKLVKGTDYKLSYSNNKKIGKATGFGVGGIEVVSMATKATKRITSKTTKVTCTSKVKVNGDCDVFPTITVKYNKKCLTENVDYTVSYKNNNKVGNASAIIEGIGKYTGTIKKTFKIIPTTPTISNVTASVGGFKVIWKKEAGNTAYQIRYNTSESKLTKMSKVNKTITNSQKTNYSFSGLSKNTTYYVQVRTYKTVNKKKFYSNWSKVKKVTTKKKSTTTGTGTDSTNNDSKESTGNTACTHIDSKGNGSYIPCYGIVDVPAKYGEETIPPDPDSIPEGYISCIEGWQNCYDTIVYTGWFGEDIPSEYSGITRTYCIACYKEFGIIYSTININPGNYGNWCTNNNIAWKDAWEEYRAIKENKSTKNSGWIAEYFDLIVSYLGRIPTTEEMEDCDKFRKHVSECGHNTGYVSKPDAQIWHHQLGTTVQVETKAASTTKVYIGRICRLCGNLDDLEVDTIKSYNKITILFEDLKEDEVQKIDKSILKKYSNITIID